MPSVQIVSPIPPIPPIRAGAAADERARPAALPAGKLRARVVAALLAAILPLLTYLMVAAEATKHASLDWLDTELHDAAVQAASREAGELGQVGVLLQALALDPPSAAASAVCAALLPRLQGGAAAISALAVHRADASPACVASVRAQSAAPSLTGAHVRAALAAGGGITMAGEPGSGLLLARAMTLPEGAPAVFTLVLDPAHLPPLGLPLRRDQVVRQLVDPDDGWLLAAQPDHAGRAGRALAMPRLLAALRVESEGVVVVQDAQGARRLVGFARLPLGSGFAGRGAMLLDLPYETLLAEADARRREQWLAAATLAALGLALAWQLAMPWLIRPARTLLSAGSGDQSYETHSLAALRPAGTWLRQQGDLAAVVESAGEMFLRLDARMRVTYASPATRTMLGQAPGEIVDADLSAEPGWAACVAQVEALRHGDVTPPACRILARRRDDGEARLEVRASRLGDGGFMLACRDVAAEVALRQELEEAQQRLAALTLADRQTGLANRRRFDEALEQELSRGRRSQEPISLVLLRLDDWAARSARLGAEQAEEVLRHIGRALAATLRRPGDLAARLDEALFGVLLPTTDRIGAQRMAERVRDAMAELGRETREAAGTARIGAGSLLPQDDTDSPDALLDLAARALQEAEAAHGTALLTARPTGPGLTALMPARVVQES